MMMGVIMAVKESREPPRPGHGHPLTPPGITRRTPTRPSRHAPQPAPAPLPPSPTPSTPAPSASTRPGASPPGRSGRSGYLARLLRLAQAVPEQHPGGRMADFLASFNFGAAEQDPSNAHMCASVDELRQRLHGVIEPSVTPTRAEHVAVTLELRASVLFSLHLTDAENTAFEGLPSIDPSLGGIRSGSMGVPQPDGLFLRTVHANDAVMNQPQDNPVLQKSVAKQIVDAIGATDGSAWAVREMSRTSRGWNFVYVCRDSQQLWKRHHANGTKMAVVGEYSLKEPDPVLMNRPAFDCRGSITIAFSCSSRTICITYDHTPIHRTVAQLAGLFTPVPRQLGPGAQRQQQKTPKKTSEMSKGGSSRKRDPNAPPRKRKKKNDGQGQQATQDGNASNGHTQQNGAYTNGQDGNGTAGTPAEQANASQLSALGLNLSAAEMARRRDFAMSLLINAGVDPNTLSADQFSIFSNQSPELQKDSLTMLAKYGAERLRIVQPNAQDSTSSATPSTPSTNAQVSQANAPAATTTKELVLPGSTQQSGRKGKAKRDTPSKTKNKGAQADAEVAAVQVASQAALLNGVKVGKSRLACRRCKENRTKCPKERPACAECESAGAACEYPPLKPRNQKSAATVGAEDDEDDAEEESQIQPPEEAQAEEDEEDEDEEAEEVQEPHNFQPDQIHGPPNINETPEYMTQNHMPTSNMLATTMPVPVSMPGSQPPHPSYFHPADGLAFPRPDPALMQYQAPQPSSASSGDQAYNAPTHVAPSHVEATSSMEMSTPSSRPVTDGATSQKSGRRVLVSSPKQRKQTAASPQAPTPAQPLSQNAPMPLPTYGQAAPSYQPPEQARAGSRQGQRSQTQTSLAAHASNFQPPAPTRSSHRSSASRSMAGSVNSASSYGSQGSYAVHNTTTDAHSISQLPYEPYTQQQQQPQPGSTRGADLQLHDYHRNQSASLPMQSQQTTPMAPALTTSLAAHSSQWTTLQNSRDAPGQSNDSMYSHNNNSSSSSSSSNNPTNPYSQRSSGHRTAGTAPLPNPSLRAPSRNAQHDHARDTRQQAQMPYQPPPQPEQQANSHASAWYGFSSSAGDPYATQSNERSYGGWKYHQDWSGAS
ncbi:hypothetical protein S40293_02828 [Stachybotrys chartarum IBT 40293]|nr:hypothetical protein S40293_02828 [Stachybotrys chartarum IBT 40293]